MNDAPKALDGTPAVERHTRTQTRHASIRSGAGFPPDALKTVFTVGCIFAWLAAMAWFRPLAAPDEGRYAGVAWEMLRSGDWLVPRLNGLPFFHKPPLFYWISAAAMSVFGVSEWPARLPSLIGATFAAAGVDFHANLTHRGCG